MFTYKICDIQIQIFNKFGRAESINMHIKAKNSPNMTQNLKLHYALNDLAPPIRF